MNMSTSHFSLINSLGHDAATACAAARAGLSRISELDTLNPMLCNSFGQESLDGLPPINGHAVFGLGNGAAGIGKIVSLAVPALQQWLAHNATRVSSARKPALLLGLSDYYVQDHHYASDNESVLPDDLSPSDLWQRQAPRIVERLFHETGLRILPENVHVDFGSHAVFGALFKRAQQLIHDQQHDLLLTLCADSLLEPACLVASADAGLMATADNPVGFLPGEAAAVGLFSPHERQGLRTDGGLWVRACHHHHGTGWDDDTLPDGRTMATLVADCLQDGGVKAQDIQQVLIDHNGLEWYAYEWGNTQLQLQQRGISLAHSQHIFPIVSFGEIGAAYGLTCLAMAEQGYQRGYYHGATLLLMTSLSGARTAALITHQHQD